MSRKGPPGLLSFDSAWSYKPTLGPTAANGRFPTKATNAALVTNVLYLRPMVQGRIGVASGSWFSPGSVVPPHDGVGDRMPPLVRCEIARLAHRRSTARSSGLRPDGTWFRASADLGVSDHAGSSSFVQAKVVPSRQIRVRITASLRAVATVAFFSPLRCTRRTAQALSGENRGTRWIRMLAAS